jgi:hypothetical protein
MSKRIPWGGEVTVNQIRIKTTPKNRKLRVDVWLKGKWLTVIESGYEIHDIIDHGLTANAVKQRARMKGIRT